MKTKSTPRFHGLAPAPVRPGAADAFNLPSLENGQRIERKRPKALLVGAPLERANQGRD